MISLFNGILQPYLVTGELLNRWCNRTHSIIISVTHATILPAWLVRTNQVPSFLSKIASRFWKSTIKISKYLQSCVRVHIFAPCKPVFDETTYTSTYRVRIHDEKVEASMVRNQKRISKSDRYASRSFEKVTSERWIYIYSYVELELVKVLKCRVIMLSTVNEFWFFVQNSTYNLYA